MCLCSAVCISASAAPAYITPVCTFHVLISHSRRRAGLNPRRRFQHPQGRTFTANLKTHLDQQIFLFHGSMIKFILQMHTNMSPVPDATLRLHNRDNAVYQWWRQTSVLSGELHRKVPGWKTPLSHVISSFMLRWCDADTTGAGLIISSPTRSVLGGGGGGGKSMETMRQSQTDLIVPPTCSKHTASDRQRRVGTRRQTSCKSGGLFDVDTTSERLSEHSRVF